MPSPILKELSDAEVEEMFRKAAAVTVSGRILFSEAEFANYSSGRNTIVSRADYGSGWE